MRAEFIQSFLGRKFCSSDQRNPEKSFVLIYRETIYLTSGFLELKIRYQATKMGEPHYPFTGPTIDGRNLSDDAASRNNIYVSIEASYTHGKGKAVICPSYLDLVIYLGFLMKNFDI